MSSLFLIARIARTHFYSTLPYAYFQSNSCLRHLAVAVQQAEFVTRRVECAPFLCYTFSLQPTPMSPQESFNDIYSGSLSSYKLQMQHQHPNDTPHVLIAWLTPKHRELTNLLVAYDWYHIYNIKTAYVKTRHFHWYHLEQDIISPEKSFSFPEHYFLPKIFLFSRTLLFSRKNHFWLLGPLLPLLPTFGYFYHFLPIVVLFITFAHFIRGQNLVKISGNQNRRPKSKNLRRS